MLAFGLPFLNPLPHEFFQYPSFRAMAAFSPEGGWGLGLLTLGSWRVWAAIWGSFRSRKYSTVAAIFAWSLLFYLFLTSEPSNPGVAIFGVWSLLEVWTLLRIRHTDAAQFST